LIALLVGPFAPKLQLLSFLRPITKTNWEGTGVAPDIKTSADASLSVAHLNAVKALLERETDSQWKQTLQQVADDLSKSASAAAAPPVH
jgi:hypothetical protein